MAWGLSLASHSEDVLSALLFLCVTFKGGHASLPRAVLTVSVKKDTEILLCIWTKKKICWLNYLKGCIGGLAVSFAVQKFMYSSCVRWSVACDQFGFGGKGTGMRFTLSRSHLDEHGEIHSAWHILTIHRNREQDLVPHRKWKGKQNTHMSEVDITFLWLFSVNVYVYVQV